MNNHRYNFQEDDIFIESVQLASEISQYQRFNQVFTMFLDECLNTPIMDGSAPTHLRLFQPQTTLNNVRRHQIIPEENCIRSVQQSQLIADDHALYVDQQSDNYLLNRQEIVGRNEQDSTQSREAQEPIPITPPPPKITSFKMSKKDMLRNNYGLTTNQVHRSLDKLKNFRILQKMCAKYRKKLGKISARDVVNLDIHKRKLTIQSGQVASFFYVEGADYTENCKRYLFGKYFIWYGRNRYALDVLNNKRIKDVEKNRPLYYQTMATFIQQIPQILQIFDNNYNNLIQN